MDELIGDRDRTADRVEHGDWALKARVRERVKDAVKRRLAAGTPAPDLGEPYLVVAVIGQSNAHGAGIAVDGAQWYVPDSRVHQWPACGRHRGRILIATEPLLHDVPGKGHGFATTFASTLADRTGRPVLLVPSARPDTSFHPKNGYTWDPSNDSARVNLYADSVARIDSALAAAPGNELAAILWHQGESDVPLLGADEYRAKLDDLIERFRTRYGPVPFLVGQMVPEEIESGHPDYPSIDAVHKAVATRHANAAFVEGPREMYNSDSEKIHYSAAGQREMGERMFTAFHAM